MSESRNLFDRMGPIGLTLGVGYLAIGGIFGFVRFLSNILYYALGPGSPWQHLGTVGLSAFIYSGLGFVMGIFGAVLTTILWPISLWIALSANEPFHQWFLFPWFEPVTISSLEPKVAIQPNEVETGDNDPVARWRELMVPVAADYQVAFQQTMHQLLAREQQITSRTPTELTDPASIRRSIHEIENTIKLVPATKLRVLRLIEAFEKQILSNAEKAGIPETLLNRLGDRFTRFFIILENTSRTFIGLVEQHFVNQKEFLNTILERSECTSYRICSEQRLKKFDDMLRDYAIKEENMKMELERIKRRLISASRKKYM